MSNQMISDTTPITDSGLGNPPALAAFTASLSA